MDHTNDNDSVTIQLPAPEQRVYDALEEGRLLEQVKAMQHRPTAAAIPQTPQPSAQAPVTPRYQKPHLPPPENKFGCVGILVVGLLVAGVVAGGAVWLASSPELEKHFVELGIVKPGKATPANPSPAMVDMSAERMQAKPVGDAVPVSVDRGAFPLKPDATLPMPAAKRVFYVTFLIPQPDGTSVLSGVDVGVDNPSDAMQSLSTIRRLVTELHKGAVIVAISELGGAK